MIEISTIIFCTISAFLLSRIESQKRIKDIRKSHRRELREKDYLFSVYKTSAECEMDRLNKELQKKMRNMFPDGTIEAVKYAMNKSHPDNGGKQEDFLKFRKLYEDLKGME